MLPETKDGRPSPYGTLASERKEIRILEIVPAVGEDMVECTMRPVALVDEPAPVYETISYYWGLPKAPSLIKLNGIVTQVPVSFEAALRRMRLSDGPRMLWIDAICINQSSLAERGQQVCLMATIYRTAKQNLVYLGEDDGHAERGVESIHNLVSEMRTATSDFSLIFQTLCEKGTGASHYSEKGLDADVDFEALESLFNLQWFRRLWVLQEAVLAPSSICHWGAFQFDLLETVRAARWLVYKFRFISQGIYDCPGWKCAAEMFDFLDPDNGFVSKQRQLAGMMEIPQRFEKTDPRDSIFAILGLLDRNVCSEGDDRAALLKVDYTKTLAEVLRDATRYSLCQSNNLKALRGANHSSDDGPNVREFSTWAGLDAPSFLDDLSYGADVLLGQGFVTEYVLETTVTCDGYYWNEYQGYQAWLHSAKRLVLNHCHPETQEDPYVAMAFTLTASEAYNRQRAQPENLLVLSEYLECLSMRKDSFISPETSVETNCCDREKMDKMYACSRVTFCLHRRFFVTSAGHMGIGPRSMRLDDLVVVIRGGTTPFILRRGNNGYHLLGPAYMHGIMDGEAVQAKKARGGLEAVFPIR